MAESDVLFDPKERCINFTKARSDADDTVARNSTIFSRGFGVPVPNGCHVSF